MPHVCKGIYDCNLKYDYSILLNVNVNQYSSTFCDYDMYESFQFHFFLYSCLYELEDMMVSK